MNKVRLEITIAGTRHANCVELLKTLRVGDLLSLRREPDNPFDPRAVAIYSGETKIGFVPKFANRTLSERLDGGAEFTVTVQDTPIIQYTRIVAEPKILIEERD